MPEYKKMPQWAKEIGIVPGMRFQNYSETIREIISCENDVVTFKMFRLEDDYETVEEHCAPWEITSFHDDYKLIFDPRSEKESQMNLREQLKKNSEEYKNVSLKNSKEYKDFSNVLKCKLIKHSKENVCEHYAYTFHTPNPTKERQMLELFCAENGLIFNYGFNSFISWE